MEISVKHNKQQELPDRFFHDGINPHKLKEERPSAVPPADSPQLTNPVENGASKASYISSSQSQSQSQSKIQKSTTLTLPAQGVYAGASPRVRVPGLGSDSQQEVDQVDQSRKRPRDKDHEGADPLDGGQEMEVDGEQSSQVDGGESAKKSKLADDPEAAEAPQGSQDGKGDDEPPNEVGSSQPMESPVGTAAGKLHGGGGSKSLVVPNHLGCLLNIFFAIRVALARVLRPHVWRGINAMPIFCGVNLFFRRNWEEKWHTKPIALDGLEHFFLDSKQMGKFGKNGSVPSFGRWLSSFQGVPSSPFLKYPMRNFLNFLILNSLKSRVEAASDTKNTLDISG